MPNYWYELHAHTSVGSVCGRVEPEDYVSYYLEKGYSGMVLTDHFYYGNCAIDRSLPWEIFVREFVQAYDRLKAEGDKHHFTVFFGLEQRFPDGNDEYLLLGLTPEWVTAHPEMKDLPREKFFDLIHAGGGFIIQAHPHRFRPSYMRSITLSPEQIDAVEVFNVCNPMEHNRQGLEYAKNLQLPMVGGSDIHVLDLPILSGISLPYPVGTSQDLIHAIRSRTHTILPNGILEELEATPLIKPEAAIYVTKGGSLVPSDNDPFCAAFERRQK